MKKNIYVNSLIALGFSLSASAFAADGTITFEGVVNGKTCSLDTNSKNMTVVLPSVLATAFGGANSASTAPVTKFTLTATGCDTGTISAAAIFATGGNVDSTNGNLNNTVAGGTDAQIRLYKADGTTPINLANYGESASNIGSTIGSNVSVDFYANYFTKNATVAAGLLKTSIQYSMQYL